MFRMSLAARSQRELNSAIGDMVRGSRKTVEVVLRQQIRLLMVDFAFHTRPYGKGSTPPAEAVKRLKERLRDTYPHPGHVVNMVKKRDEAAGVALGILVGNRGKRSFQAAQKIIDKWIPEKGITIGAFDKGALHKAQRDNDYIKRRLLVVSRTQVEAYIKRTIRMLGFAKSAFANAAAMLGGARGIPAWAKRHKGAPGTAIVTGTGASVTVTTTNGVRHIRHALSKSGERAAMRNRAATIAADLRNKQEARIRRRLARANQST
jgi:hypothetical protein